MTASWNLDKVDGEDSVTVIPSSEMSALLTDVEVLSVLVLSQNFIATYPFPEAGEVTVGRSHSVEIYVDDPIVSRRHAILSATPAPSIRDLGSSNGTRVLGQQLAPGTTQTLAVGDVVMVGSTALLIQRGAATVRPRRFWTQEHFEDRLREECSRAERTGSRFSVACLQVGRHVPDVVVRQLLARTLRTSDVVGECGRAMYAILIVDTQPGQSRVVINRIAADLSQVAAGWGVAEFPGDGKTGDELLAKAQIVADEPGPGPALSGSEGRVVADAVTQELFRVADRIAAGDISVLILGETGVGKEVMAEEIHRRSPRRARPFLRLNCAALSETLLESELFGHERGAFTSAVAAKPGLLETADGGVVLLDEIGELPMSLQVKLLRVIEEKQVRRVGGLKSRLLDVRFLAATNRDLQEHAARGLFRMDLYYRLAGATLSIPPLRERPGDIEPLVRTFLLQASRHLGGQPATITTEALAALVAYRWPGNIRELRHVIERAVLLAGSAPITPAHLPVEKVEK
nr:sigma 54-interacting transcriptional regulator [Deltaproteobacteria bacterium]